MRTFDDSITLWNRCFADVTASAWDRFVELCSDDVVYLHPGAATLLRRLSPGRHDARSPGRRSAIFQTHAVIWSACMGRPVAWPPLSQQMDEARRQQTGAVRRGRLCVRVHAHSPVRLPVGLRAARHAHWHALGT